MAIMLVALAIPFLVGASVLEPPDLSPVAVSRALNEPAITLVSEGCAHLPIVTVDGPRERKAAFYLASVIRDITGVRPDIYVDTPRVPVAVSPALHILASDATDTFRVVTRKGSVYFMGRSDFAVYDWCERLLGVRFYATPKGIPGQTVPHTDALVVEAVDYTDWPVFPHRDNWPFGRQPWARASKAGGAHKGGVAVHAPHRWFADPDIRTNHPAIFARQPDGSRGEMPLLCYGNPETLAYYEQRIDEHIAGLRDSGGIVDTNRHVITVSHWDVLLDCTCAHCCTRLNPALGMSGYGSPVIWSYFLKQLAQWARAKHPDYTIAFLPYLNVCDVPPGLDLTEEGNCEAMVCSMPGLALFKEPSIREHEEALIRSWARVTGRKVINWHYGCWPREFTTAPYLFGREIAAHYRRMQPFEVGSFINAGNGTAAEQLMNYVWLRCLWNPYVDVDAIYDVFAERMFGAAAKPMRQLMTLQEEGWARRWDYPKCCQHNTFEVSYPAADVAEMKHLLRSAFLAVTNDVAAAQRVHWYAADFVKFFRDEKRYRAGVGVAPLNIVRMDAAPKIGGERNESWWSEANGRELVPAFNPDGTPTRSTRMWAAWTDEGVCLAFRCHEPALTNLNRTAAYGELQKQDTLEVFFDPSGTTTGTCYRVMVDIRNRVSTTADVVWRPKGVVTAVTEQADAWLVEMFIPFAMLGNDVSRTQWRGNVIRWHPGPAGERERTRLATHGGEWNQDRDAFCIWRFGTDAIGESNGPK